MQKRLKPGLCATLLFALAAAAAVAREPEATFEILLLGDTSFGENYQDRLAAVGRESVLRTRGYDYLIGAFAELLGGASLVIANLETPITGLRRSPHRRAKAYLHYADPELTPRTLRKFGVDVVSLANNHSLDFGAAGLDETVDVLDRYGIAHCGAGRDAAAARRPFSHPVTLGQVRFQVFVICAFEYSREYDTDFDFYATETRPGTNRLSVHAVAEQIEAIRALHRNAYIIVFPHWGRNYQLASLAQRRLARRLIDAGGDLVVGHGSHMLQQLERRRGRWIVHSLGNFVFASPGRYAKFGAPPYSMIASIRLNATGDGVEETIRLYPIFSNNLISGYRNRFVTADEFDQVWRLLATHSVVAEGFDQIVRRGRDRHGFYLELGGR